MDPRAYRLPRTAIPRRYDVAIDARLGRDTFHGTVAIALDLAERVDAVETHARGLGLQNARVRAGGRSVAATPRLHPERETVTFELTEAVGPGPATLEADFLGHVDPGLKALYEARDGPERCLATQFQSTDARGVFPCFDEPSFKAVVAWTVTTDKGATVLTNGPLLEKTDLDERSTTWKFGATRPISVYLAAAVIGDFAPTAEIRARGNALRVWALAGKEKYGEFANEFASRLLPWYEDYFGAPYAFQKYDQVAVPGFAAGAMENVGLVTFRQILLLLDAPSTSWRQEKRIARVVAHEFAHMWFGNLVTMRWWDDTWLNESFAEWVAHKAVDALAPDYRVWDETHADRADALAADALASTHAIYAPVETPEQAAEMFDAVTYYKGSAVMRMLENYLGEERFRAGLRTYMREFAERNAVGADLWRHLDAASGEPVDRIMGAWIRQPGHPLVRVALVSEQSGEAVVRLEQRRFFSRPGATRDDAMWPVPVVFKYGDDGGLATKRLLLSARDATVTLPLRGRLQWVTANLDGVGFYRQDLDDALLARALANARHLSPAEKIYLLIDEWGLARNGTRPVTRFLKVLETVAPTLDHAVLERVVEHLYEVEDMLVAAGDEGALDGFRKWVVRTMGPELYAVKLEPQKDEPRAASQQRVSLVAAVASIGRDWVAIENARNAADRELADRDSVQPDLANAVVAVAAQFGDAARFDRHVREYEARRAAGASPQAAGRYLQSLWRFEAPALVERTLALMDERVVPQEAVGPFLRAMLEERHAQRHAWTYLKRNFHLLRERLGDMWMGFLVEACGALPAELRPEVKAFFDENLKGLAEMSYARAMERMDLAAEFRARTRDDLVKWARGL